MSPQVPGLPTCGGFLHTTAGMGKDSIDDSSVSKSQVGGFDFFRDLSPNFEVSLSKRRAKKKSDLQS